jgi:hypothetical protein
MAFVPLGDMYPEIAPQETRVFHILREDDVVPKGEYGYVELFCDEKNCNCRRTIIRVLNEEGKSMALIGFGWGTKAQYRKWMGAEISNQDYKDLRGPCHHDGIKASEYADFFLTYFKNEMMKDKNYIERIKRHYRMVRKYVVDLS